MAQIIVSGTAEGRILALGDGLSFWGGVDAATGRIVDVHHPACGQSLAGRIVVMPTSRGSCSGSGVLLELALNGHAPAALVFRDPEDVLTLGAVIAGRMFDRRLPVLRLGQRDHDSLAAAERAEITATHLIVDGRSTALAPLRTDRLTLTEVDRRMLDGEDGEAARLAMEVIVTMAAGQGAAALVDVTRAHIDGCIYAGPANLRFARRMAEMGARVRVPTTTNAISVDHAHWRAQGVPPALGLPAQRLADAYVEMGARPSFTCAPYLLDDAPGFGEFIGWSESNAVIYANSVLGARSVKHPDFLDLFVALTGRAPLSGVYLDADRKARRVIRVDLPEGHDDALWPMLGWLAGMLAPDRIPLISGLERAGPSDDDLKALCAAFGTTSAAPMLHVAGVTPEAGDAAASDGDVGRIGRHDLAEVWRRFNAGPRQVDLVAFGSPHFSLSDCRALATSIEGRTCSADVATIVTLGRDVLAEASREGIVQRLGAAGVRVVPDICWCSISEPVFPPSAKVLMTNSGKYAHYAPGLSGRQVRFGSMADCVDAAVTGLARGGLPDWLD